MKNFSTKNLIFCALFTALLLASQLILSSIAGVEIISILLLAFCYKKGVKNGLLVATAFSLLRCFIFGFMPNVIILYLIYYNLFAVVFGLVGKCFSYNYSLKSHVVCVVLSGIMTVCFTLLDCVITPLIFAFNYDSTSAYFIASIPVIIPHTICVVATTIALFFPLIKVLSIKSLQK